MFATQVRCTCDPLGPGHAAVLQLQTYVFPSFGYGIGAGARALLTVAGPRVQELRLALDIQRPSLYFQVEDHSAPPSYHMKFDYFVMNLGAAPAHNVELNMALDAGLARGRGRGAERERGAVKAGAPHDFPLSLHVLYVRILSVGRLRDAQNPPFFRVLGPHINCGPSCIISSWVPWAVGCHSGRCYIALHRKPNGKCHSGRTCCIGSTHGHGPTNQGPR